MEDSAVLKWAPLISGLLDPQGPVGRAEKTILIDALLTMLVIVVPVILCTLAFAWWFRASNPRATRYPTWSYSGRIELVTWSLPLLIILFLGGTAWVGSFALDPARPMSSARGSAVDIEVVSLDWKWLFIYPAQHIASINKIVIPTNVPIHFQLTSTGVMNSFFVPQLGSQIYTMPRMTTQLYLEADHSGRYVGQSAQFSGDGFSDMRFLVEAIEPADYQRWVEATQTDAHSLNATTFEILKKPSVNAESTYGHVVPGLFQQIVGR